MAPCSPLGSATEYVTPLVKSLIRKRNRMRKRSHFKRAEVLAQCINALITEKRSNALDKLADCNAKELWNAVNKTRNIVLLAECFGYTRP